MKLIPLLFVSIFFIVSNIAASNTIIKGNAKSFKGKEIVVYTYSDYITKNQEKIGFTTITANGAFNFEFEDKSIKKVIIKVEDKTTWFFTQPGKIYNINLSYDEEYNKGRIYDKLLSLKFSFPVPNELNQQVKKFNQKYDEFIEENTIIFKRRDRSIEPKIAAFKIKTLKEFESSSSKFLIQYITYSIASMQNALDVSYNVYTTGKNSEDTKANIYLAYLNNKPVQYNNPEYITFFKDFFKGEFKALTLQKVEGIKISNTINDNASYTELQKELGKSPFLVDDEFKNLFLLNGLREVYNGTYFNKKNIIKILTDIQKTTKYPEQKKIANNIITLLTLKKIGKGSKAPDFSLKNANGELVSLNDLKGKHLYLSFWATWSIPALREMKIMQTLQKKYKGKIQFVSICVDNEDKKMTAFLKENPNYNWLFLHNGNDKHLTDKYKVRTFPTYFLIDKNGLIVKAPAGRPGGSAERETEDNIEKDFYNLIKGR